MEWPIGDGGEFEKPHGEWNTLEIYILGRESVHVVNGHVVMALHNIGLIEKPGDPEVPLTSGQLQIQCEGAEAFYRRLEMRPITAFPPEIKKAAGF